MQKVNWAKLKVKIYPVLLVIGGIFFLLLLYQVISNFSRSDLWDVWEPIYFLLSLPLILTVHTLQILNYYFTIREGYPNVTIKSIIIGYGSTFIPKYIPGGLWGYISRDRLLSLDYSIPSKWVWETSIYEILYVLGTAAIVGSLTFLDKAYFILVGIISVPILYIAWKGLGLFSKRINRSDIFSLTLKTWFLVNGITVIQWGLYGFSLALLLRSASYASFNVLMLSSIYSLSWLIGFLVILAPFGLGVREVTLATLLTKFLDIDPTIASFLAVTSRLTVIISELLWFLVATALRKTIKMKN